MIEGFAALRAPFPKSAISKLDRGNGLVLDYVGHAAVTARLLEVDPLWTWEPLAVEESGLPRFDPVGGLWIRLTVLGVTRLGYGDTAGKKGANAVKEAIGDAIRNAAMRFGVALDLWSKDDISVTVDDRPKPTAAQVKTWHKAIQDAQNAEQLADIAKDITGHDIDQATRQKLIEAYNQQMGQMP